jgi:hypothetical protein
LKGPSVGQDTQVGASYTNDSADFQLLAAAVNLARLAVLRMTGQYGGSQATTALSVTVPGANHPTEARPPKTPRPSPSYLG